MVIGQVHWFHSTNPNGV